MPQNLEMCKPDLKRKRLGEGMQRIENSFLYIVPLYLQAEGANFPQRAMLSSVRHRPLRF